MEKAVELLKSLVDIPSSSGNESEILIYLEKWLIKEGFDFVVREETFVAGQIKAIVNNGQKKEAIILAGHVGNLLAAASFIGQDLSQDIWVVGTANEELDGKGSEDFARYFSQNRSYESALCVIAEPTDLEKIYIGHVEIIL